MLGWYIYKKFRSTPRALKFAISASGGEKEPKNSELPNTQATAPLNTHSGLRWRQARRFILPRKWVSAFEESV
jgi:hypothetical protein